MPVRFLSNAQREQLSGFPMEINDEVLDRILHAQRHRLGQGPPAPGVGVIWNEIRR
ncbi:MAG TPA: hypothetical protein VK784_11095 [Pseudonocardiaceae bacterium]|jgi:hypothetical protein|nr:hypothetical protein [Pseudonocardiaceae bacterium]